MSTADRYRAGCLAGLLFAVIAAPSALPREPEYATAGESLVVHPAVVALRVPLRREREGGLIHVTEACSATLIDEQKGWLLTAWHCVDGIMDLTRPPLAWIDAEWHELDVVAAGGAMESDWALLRLRNTKVARGRTMAITTMAAELGATLLVSGYPRDAQLNTGSAPISISRSCQLMGSRSRWLVLDCDLEKGMSGGPVTINRPDGPVVMGIVSARDSRGHTLLMPLAHIPYRFEPP